MLGGLPKAPTEDSPTPHFKRAKDRQRYVLGQMLENKFITDAGVSRRRCRSRSRSSRKRRAAQPRRVALLRRARPQARAGQVRRRATLRSRPPDLHDARHAAAARRRGRGAQRARGVDRRFGFRGPIGHLDDDEARRVPRGDADAVHGGRSRTALAAAAGAIVPGKIYLARSSEQGKKAYRARRRAARGASTTTMRRASMRWTERRGNKLDAGDLIPVRVAKVEVKHGSGKKAYVETVETGAAGAAARRAGGAGRRRSGERPSDGDGRRLRLRSVAVQSRDAGASARRARRSSRTSTRRRSRTASPR